VTQLLGLTTSELKSSYTNDFGTPKNADSYRFYLGGPVYDIPRVESVLEKVSLTPDAKTNPLGIYYRDGGLEIRNDVQITGTLIVRESVFISGRNVQLQASPFRGVGQPATATRFPALVALDDITLSSDCGVRIVGTVLAGDRFHVNDGLDSVSVSITGRVVAGRVQIEGRWPWYLSESTWKSVYDAFRLQLMLDPNNRVDHFPDFLAILGRSSQPRIKIEPATASEVIDHWQAVDGPVYQPVATGQGMKWDVIDWTEQPNQTAP
jgi:hypothetical protein